MSHVTLECSGVQYCPYTGLSVVPKDLREKEPKGYQQVPLWAFLYCSIFKYSRHGVTFEKSLSIFKLKVILMCNISTW
jgi:hypothetical protein